MNERVRDILNHPATIPAAVGVVSFGAGVAVGYFVATRQQAEVIVEADDDIQLKLDFSEAFDELKAKREENLEDRKSIHPPIPAERVDKLVNEDTNEDLEAYIDYHKNVEYEEERGIGPDDPRPNPADITVYEDPGIMGRIDRIIAKGETPTADDYIRPVGFAHDDEDWDYVEELKGRKASAPYILHKDEFYADEMGYSQITLCYYAGDDIMCDEDDSPIYDYKTVTGPLRFGHGSDDPNVFHVRNEKHKSEYEILFHEGLYSIEVLGLEIEENSRVNDLKHSRVPKFKLE